MEISASSAVSAFCAASAASGVVSTLTAVTLSAAAKVSSVMTPSGMLQALHLPVFSS